MKQTLALGLALTLLSQAFTGCKKDASESADVALVKKNLPVGINIAFNLAIMMREGMIENSCQLFSCPNSISMNDLGSYKLLRFDFGAGCTGTDGVVRKGSIEDSIVFISGTAGYVHYLFFNEYFEGDVRVYASILEGGQLDNMFSTRRFYSSMQQLYPTYYTPMANGGFQSELPDILIVNGSDKNMQFQFTGYLGLVNLNATGYQDDVYTFPGKVFISKEYGIQSSTYIKNTSSKETYDFANNVAPHLDFSCGGAKKIKGGSYTFSILTNNGASSSVSSTSDFSFSNDCN